MDDEDRITYVVLCAAGLEDLAGADVAARCGVPASRVRVGRGPPESDRWDPSAPPGIWPGAAGVGRLLVSLPRPRDGAGWDARRRELASLPCAAGLLALVCEVGGVEASHHGLDAVHAAVRGAARWPDALEAHRRHRRLADGEVPFRASAVRDGRHDWTSEDLARCVGDACPSDAALAPNLERFELEVVALCLQSACLVGLNLWPRDATFRRSGCGAEPRPLLPFAGRVPRLRLSTAALMLTLAGVEAGDVVLDPMCGVGTIPALAAALLPVAFALGGDVEPDSVARARANALGDPRGDDDAWHADERTYAGGSGAAECCAVWSSDALPLRSGSVDRVVVDLPFGKMHQVRGKGGRVNARRSLLEKTLGHCARCARPGGRLVALAGSRRALDDAVDAAHWRHGRKLPINCGGAVHWIGVYERTAEPWAGHRRPAFAPKKRRGKRRKAAPDDVGAAGAAPGGGDAREDAPGGGGGAREDAPPGGGDAREDIPSPVAPRWAAALIAAGVAVAVFRWRRRHL